MDRARILAGTFGKTEDARGKKVCPVNDIDDVEEGDLIRRFRKLEPSAGSLLRLKHVVLNKELESFAEEWHRDIESLTHLNYVREFVLPLRRYI
jgi:hypothetical protein